MLKECKKCNNTIIGTHCVVCRKSYKQLYYKLNKEKINTNCNNNYRLNYKIKHSEISCPNCKINFIPKSSLAKCCSRKCSDQLWKSINIEHTNKWHHEHYHNNTNRRLATCIRSRTNKALKGAYKKYSVTEYLGCSPEYLKQYLESKFQPDMSWDNYGRNGWHIDHITPLASFDLSDGEQFSKACHYTNLQPLWAEDNIRKGDKNE